MTFLFRALGADTGRPLQKLQSVLDEANQLGSQLKRLSDTDLKRRAVSHRSAHPAETGAGPGRLATSLAIAREAADRVTGLQVHDVQMLGAAALANGFVAEMLTGEGKTLAAVLAVFAESGSGRGIHVVTANDYLAARDADWMGPLYRFLGVTVGYTGPGMTGPEKREAYGCDVTYGTAREFAFDFLRDTLARHAASRVQRGHHLAIVDEADFVLLDEARLPFVITEAVPARPDGLLEAAAVVTTLELTEDFLVDDAQRTVWLTERGIHRAESITGAGTLEDPSSTLVADLHLALRARGALQRDRDYVVGNDRVEIVDEFTGRVLPGRRWADGLHQAVEAKEGVTIRSDIRPLAQTTTRSYFRRYERLAGMTGTATPAGSELAEAYGLRVVSIPPNRPVARIDRPDLVYSTAAAKYQAVVDDIVDRHELGQPVLVGTASVGHSDYVSSLLATRGIEHRVLNAKHPSAEAAIVAEAGRIGAVTVATNMAGRGVDIRLGGTGATPDGSPLPEDTEEVIRRGGLCVIGTERHESRRVDEQLRGRAGRQGDPGESVFYVSLEDDLITVHGPPTRHLIDPDFPEPMTDRDALRAGQVAQSNMEARNRDIRAATQQYDEILDFHYAGVCDHRTGLIDGRSIDRWTEECLETQMPTLERALHPDAGAGDAGTVRRRYASQRDRSGSHWEEAQRQVMLAVLEHTWSAFLAEMHEVRGWVNMAALGGTFPITEWRMRSNAALQTMWQVAETDYLRHLLEAAIIEGRRPPRRPEPTLDTQPPQVYQSQPVLPRSAPRGKTRHGFVMPDWAEGFAGPAFQEIVMMVDMSGAGAAQPVAEVDLADDPAATTIYIDGATR